MQVIVDGLLIDYAEHGTGKTVVLLHGWADRAAGLADLGQALAKKYRVIACDLPGFGASDTPGDTWGLDNYAQLVAHFLEKIGVRDVWLLLGHSNGGAIALRAVSRGWLQPERLVLMAAAGIRGEQKSRLRVLKTIAKTGKILTAPLPPAARQTLRRKLYAAAGSDLLVAEHLQETFKKVVSDDVRADAAGLTTPTLLLYGENDQDAPVWYGERFHELITGSTLEILPGAGHFVHLDRPVDVARAILEFAR